MPAGQISVTTQQPGCYASKATPSGSDNENLASSVEQTCLEATKTVANGVQNLEDSIPRMILVKEPVLARSAALEDTLQLKAELLQPSADDFNTFRADIKGLLE